MLSNKKEVGLRRDKGQILPIIAILMVVLLAFSGLAIDGGSILLAKRDAQNAADAATFAATRQYCLSNDPAAAVSKGDELASLNGFEDGPSENVVTTTNFFWTTEEGAPGSLWPQIPNYATISTINVEVPRYFSVIAFGGALAATAVSASNCQGVHPLAENEVAVYAFSQTCQDPFNLAESDVEIYGGVISRGDFKATGSQIQVHGIVEYGRYYQSDAMLTPSTGNPVYDPNNQKPTLYTYNQFLQGGYYAESAQAEGLYHHFNTNKMFNTNGADKDIIFEGLYVIVGKGSIIGNNYTVGPKGATFVTLNDFSISATSITLKPYVGGLLIYSDAVSNCGNNAISLSASLATIEGIIYSPNGGCRIDASDTNATVAIFCETVDLHGSSLTLTYYEVIEGLMPPRAMWYTE